MTRPPLSVIVLVVAGGVTSVTKTLYIWGMGLHRVITSLAPKTADGGGTHILHHIKIFVDFLDFTN